MMDALECCNKPLGSLIYGEFHDYKRTSWVPASARRSLFIVVFYFIHHKRGGTGI